MLIVIVYPSHNFVDHGFFILRICSFIYTYFVFSRYIFFYQVPFIPELLIEADDFAILKQIFCAKPMGLINKNMTPDDLEVFKYTFSQKGK